mgnify:CR=1
IRFGFFLNNKNNDLQNEKKIKNIEWKNLNIFLLLIVEELILITFRFEKSFKYLMPLASEVIVTSIFLSKKFL